MTAGSVREGVDASALGALKPSLAAEPLVAALDALASGAIALLGALAAAFVQGSLNLDERLGVALAVLAALAGPLGAGVERGRAPALVRLLAPLGASLGALSGAFLLGAREPLALLVRAGTPLVLGPLLVPLGARWHRPEEPWRAEARLRPAEATPEIALRLARARLPVILRVVLWPTAVALAPLALAGLVLIRGYQLCVSRLLPPQCRFEPSCSRYGFQAILRHGALKGGLLTIVRLARCQPFCKAGHDPVPDPSGEARG